MDNPLSDTYLGAMFTRVIMVLAVLAIIAVTTVTSAHAVRMSVEPATAGHVSDMMQAPHNSELSCDLDQHCGTADAGLCDFVCLGLSAFLTTAGQETEHECGPAGYELATVANHASLTPGLGERPPRLCFL